MLRLRVLVVLSAVLGLALPAQASRTMGQALGYSWATPAPSATSAEAPAVDPRRTLFSPVRLGPSLTASSSPGFRLFEPPCASFRLCPAGAWLPSGIALDLPPLELAEEPEIRAELRLFGDGFPQAGLLANPPSEKGFRLFEAAARSNESHRLRWYDSRNASWLSEDPMGPIDSPSRYAFVGWSPAMATDPLGLCAGDWAARWLGIGCAEGEDDAGYAGDFGGGTWDTVKETGQGIKELGKLIRDEGVGVAVETVVTGTIDAIVEAPENLVNWLEFMAEASPEEAARGFGRLAGGAGLMVATGGAGKVVGIGGRAATRAVGAAGRRAGRAVANLAEGIGDRVNLQRRFRQIPCNCFAAGTLVLTDAGLVPIEEIAVGDRVLAYDDATGLEELAEVVGLFQKETEALWLLTIAGETFEVTDEHPIYVADRGWTGVGDLEVGNVLVGEGGERHPVESLERIEQTATVYNFEVAGLHSYFVGEVGVVAHNCPVRRKIPEFVKERWRAGNEFNRINRPRYKYNEVEVRLPDGSITRVDSYVPGREIVERKFTQLAEVKESTAIGYLRSVSGKYPQGATITDQVFNPRTLRGRRLRGQHVLEVPIQRRMVPLRLRQLAREIGVVIRDVDGRMYR